MQLNMNYFFIDTSDVVQLSGKNSRIDEWNPAKTLHLSRAIKW